MGIRQSRQDWQGVHCSRYLYQSFSVVIVNLLESSVICLWHILFLSFNINYKTFYLLTKYKNYNLLHHMHIQTHPTFAYTHPTTHTNTLNHYHFILKQKKKKKKTKHKTHPIKKFQIIITKKIMKNIKPNHKKIK